MNDETYTLVGAGGESTVHDESARVVCWVNKVFVGWETSDVRRREAWAVLVDLIIPDNYLATCRPHCILPYLLPVMRICTKALRESVTRVPIGWKELGRR